MVAKLFGLLHAKANNDLKEYLRNSMGAYELLLPFIRGVSIFKNAPLAHLASLPLLVGHVKVSFQGFAAGSLKQIWYPSLNNI